MINAFQSIESSNIPEFGTLLLVRELRIPYIWYMSTAELKTSIRQLLEGIKDDSVLQAVYNLLSNASLSNDWYDSLSEEAKSSIQRGIEDADNNRFVSQEEVQAKVDKLLGRA